jgi:hypothetical protein
LNVFRAIRPLQIGEHRSRLVQLRMKVLLEQVEDFAQDWIAERVIDLVTAFAADDHLLGPQDGEVLGQVGLFNRAVAVSGSLRLPHVGAPQTE